MSANIHALRLAQLFQQIEEEAHTAHHCPPPVCSPVLEITGMLDHTLKNVLSESIIKTRLFADIVV
jgi:hypothetical protein